MVLFLFSPEDESTNNIDLAHIFTSEENLYGVLYVSPEKDDCTLAKTKKMDTPSILYVGSNCNLLPLVFALFFLSNYVCHFSFFRSKVDAPHFITTTPLLDEICAHTTLCIHRRY